jgi:hypothetical protein
MTTVKELIEILKKYDGDYTVSIRDCPPFLLDIYDENGRYLDGIGLGD